MDSFDSEASITDWITRAKVGDEPAAQKSWDGAQADSKRLPPGGR
jgi:hypothetical protein